MYDSVVYNVRLAETRSEILLRLKLNPKGYTLGTGHPAEDTDDPGRLRLIFQSLDQIAQAGLPVIVPVHPRTRRQLESWGLSPSMVQLINPLSYLDML